MSIIEIGLLLAPWVLLALIMGELVFFFRAIQHVRGSYPRYVYITLEKCCEIGVMLTLATLAVLNAMNQDMTLAGLDLVLLLYRIWLWKKRFNDDDHWFNKQWKRLKRGLKKLKRQLATLAPLPMPSPA